MKRACFLSLIVIMLLLAACSKRDLADMKSFEGDGYIGIEWDDREYVPYCALDWSGGGSLIGCLDGDKKEEIYSFEDYSAEEWIVDHSKYDGTSMLYREINVTEITHGIQSEYEWNH